MMLGDFEVTALNDGVVSYPSAEKTLPKATPEEIENGLSANCLTNPIGMSYNAFLINTGTRLVLIDAGTGGKGTKYAVFRGCGHVLANLRAAGYHPGQIDEVYITHTHLDHVEGLTLGTQRAFPNATVRATKGEVDGFLNPVRRAAAPSEAKTELQSFADLFEPYVKAGKFADFEGDIPLVPGIRALATPGHTQGHTSYVVESGGQTLVVLGDLVHVGAVPFPYPSVYFGSDADPKAATAQRVRVFQMAADGGYWVAGAHLSFPGIGHVRAVQKRYLWVPAIYTNPLD